MPFRPSQKPSEVPASQSQKAAAGMERGEQERKINELVTYLLIMDQRKVPIKKQDINKNVLKEHSRAFPIIMKEALNRLAAVFGIEAVELQDKGKGSYVLVNKLDIDSEDNHLEWSADDDRMSGFLMVVLSFIFMSGNVIQENQLWSFMRKLGIDPDFNNNVFGDVKKLVTQDWARQGYVEMVRVPNADPPITEIKWGQRTIAETSKSKVLNFVSQVYGVEPDQWTSQWQEVLDTEGEQQPPATERPSTSRAR